MSFLSGLGGLVGSVLDTGANLFMNKTNTQTQKDFAKKGLSWKVADAKRAGLHPLAALGAQTFPYTPAFGSDGFGFSELGQNIDRARGAGVTEAEKLQLQILKLQVERGDLENDLLRSQLSTMNQPGAPSNSGMYSLVNGGDTTGSYTGSRYFSEVPVEVEHTSPTGLGLSAGSFPEISYGRSPNGSLSVYMSKDAKDKLEEDFLGSALWSIRNRLLPLLFESNRPPKPDLRDLPKGKGYVDWRWSRVSGRWYPVTAKDVTHPWKKNNDVPYFDIKR